MSFEAKIIEHSISPHGIQLPTFALRYPRFIHAEFMTHRVFSRNASSSRAIPVTKMIEMVRTNPAMPIHWGKNQPGMQAHEELSEPAYTFVKGYWRDAAEAAAKLAGYMNDMGAHKQVVNRILEPFQWISVIVTATEWDNFFELRDHPDAQPEIRHLAQLMRKALAESTPVERHGDPGYARNWHLPYISEEERNEYALDPFLLAKVSAARCARVSYLNHDGTKPDFEKDLALYDRLVGSVPLHASPVEHQGYPIHESMWSNNFRGWRQHRKIVEGKL